MALETKTEFSDEKKASGWFHDMNLIGIEKAYCEVVARCTMTWGKIRDWYDRSFSAPRGQTSSHVNAQERRSD